MGMGVLLLEIASSGIRGSAFVWGVLVNTLPRVSVHHWSCAQVTVTVEDAEGNETTIKDQLGPSDYFGEMALLKDEPRMASVKATSASVCFKLDRATFISVRPWPECGGHACVPRDALCWRLRHSH